MKVKDLLQSEIFNISSIVSVVNASNNRKDEYIEDNFIISITFTKCNDGICICNKELISDDILNSDIVRIHNEHTFRTGLGRLILVI